MFAATMITIDRSPKQNYAGETLKNLARSGAFRSPWLKRFRVFDSGSPSLDFLAGHVPFVFETDTATRNPTQNAAAALRWASQQGEPWCLFLEDDIDVCGRFIESVGGWLTDHAEDYRVFPLGANYDLLLSLRNLGQTAWKYPIDMFYGTLGLAIRAKDAAAIADWWEEKDRNQVGGGHPYDIYITEWARVQAITHFLTPVPSFVQHTGNESVIRPGSVFHIYDSWPGREWFYKRRRSFAEVVQ